MKMTVEMDVLAAAVGVFAAAASPNAFGRNMALPRGRKGKEPGWGTAAAALRAGDVRSEGV